MQLTEAEAAFKIHKSDLSIRPIWHQKEERVLAHILVCFLAYVLWKTLGHAPLSPGRAGRRTATAYWTKPAEIRLCGKRRPAHDSRRHRDPSTLHLTPPTEHQQILYGSAPTAIALSTAIRKAKTLNNPKIQCSAEKIGVPVIAAQGLTSKVGEVRLTAKSSPANVMIRHSGVHSRPLVQDAAAGMIPKPAHFDPERRGLWPSTRNSRRSDTPETYRDNSIRPRRVWQRSLDLAS